MRTLVLWMLLAVAAVAQPLSCPGTPAKPVEVRVGLYVLDINFIHSNDQNYSLNGFLTTRWKDPRMAGKAGHYKRDQLWTPGIDVSNASEYVHMQDSPVEVKADGTCSCFTRFKATLNSDFDLQSFPFDRTDLIFDVQATNERYDLLRLISDGDMSDFQADEFEGEWEIRRKGFEGHDFATRPTEKGPDSRYAETRFNIPAERHWQYYLWLYFVPLLLVVMTTWTVMWTMPPNIQVTTTALLGAIMHRLAVGSVLPRLHLLTYADGFFLLSLFFIVGSNIAVSGLLRLDERKSERRDTMRRVCSVGFPLSYLIAQGILWKVFFP